MFPNVRQRPVIRSTQFGVAGRLPPLLDVVTTAATVAWGFRRLRGAWSGNASLVRRSSDSTTQDIAFTGNDYDSASALSFVGGGNDGFVSRWYDQTGNGRYQDNASNQTQQPKIIAAGVLQTMAGGRAGMLYDGVDDCTFAGGSQAVSDVATASAYTAIGVARWTATGNLQSGGELYNGNNPIEDSLGYFFPVAGRNANILLPGTGRVIGGGHFSTVTEQSAIQGAGVVDVVVITRFTGGVLQSWVNGQLAASDAAANIATLTGTIRTGKDYNSTNFFAGNFAEAAIWNIGLSNSDLNALLMNAAAYHLVPVVPIS